MKAGYEGVLEVWKNSHLTPVEQIIEHHFVHYLQNNLTPTERQYKTEHGNVLDTDKARSFSSVWNLSNESRALLSSAVHNPASAFVNSLYQKALKQRRRGSVIFTAGGGGSGKSVAMELFATRVTLEAHVIYDTTLSHQSTALEKIEAARQYGRSVYIIFVYRPFPAAVQGVIQRALLSGGRTVPLSVLASDHCNAPRTVLHIVETYAGDNQVQVIVLDNSGYDVSDIRNISETEEILEFLRSIAYNDEEKFQRQAKGILENEKDKGYLPDYLVAALERSYKRGKGA